MAITPYYQSQEQDPAELRPLSSALESATAYPKAIVNLIAQYIWDPTPKAAFQMIFQNSTGLLVSYVHFRTKYTQSYLTDITAHITPTNTTYLYRKSAEDIYQQIQKHREKILKKSQEYKDYLSTLYTPRPESPNLELVSKAQQTDAQFLSLARPETPPPK